MGKMDSQALGGAASELQIQKLVTSSALKSLYSMGNFNDGYYYAANRCLYMPSHATELPHFIIMICQQEWI